MNTYTHFWLLLWSAVFILGCEPVDPGDPTNSPSDCGYEVPTLDYSDPNQCEPTLQSFYGLSKASDIPEELLPPLPKTGGQEGTTRTIAVNAVEEDGFVLHLYKGVPGPIRVEVFGQLECGVFDEVLPLMEVSEIARRLEIAKATADYQQFYVRVSLAPEEYSEENFVALAAYGKGEPGPAGAIAYRTGEPTKDVDPDEEQSLARLPFSCDGKAFQRLVLSACEKDAKTVMEWVAATGMTPSEEYYGPLGNVVVFDIPPGLDLNTTGGAITQLRSKVNGGDATIEPDWLVNLFNPLQPYDIASSTARVPTAVKDPNIQDILQGNAIEYFGKVLPTFSVPEKFDEDMPLNLITFIDSGVDLGSTNGSNWESTRYRGGLETEYIKDGNLGFDFVAKDFTPNDLTPHGTHVAAATLGEYRSSAPLNMIHLKTFGNEGISSYFGTLVSIYEAAAIGSDIINMSWGVYLDDKPEALLCAIETAISTGAYIVTSAGNDDKDIDVEPQWPAAFAPMYPENILTTASYWYEGNAFSPDPNLVNLIYFTNFGSVNTSMAGFITTPVPEYQTGDIIYPLGTSITAPIVTGALLEHLVEDPSNTLGTFQNLLEPSSKLSGKVSGDLYLPLDTQLNQP